jgi:hypothetical protein
MRVVYALVMLSGGCFDFGGPWTWKDPCRDHGNSGNLLGNDCSCPLESQLGPQLDGTPCNQSGKRCAVGWLGPSCTCEFEPLRWYCGDADLAIPSPPPDLSLSLDGATVDGSGRD